jgi:uncharacterized protein (DUF433 family)
MRSTVLITIAHDIVGGTPVFKGPRVPVQTRCDDVDNNGTPDEFLKCFPSVTDERARRISERSEAALLLPTSA